MDKNVLIGLIAFLVIVFVGLIYAFVKKPAPPLLPESGKNKGWLYPIINLPEIPTTTSVESDINQIREVYNLLQTISTQTPVISTQTLTTSTQ